MWTTAPQRDSQDADGVTAEVALTNIKSWFVAQPGFISLQHDISTLSTTIAIKALAAIKAIGPSFPLKVKTIPQCLSDSNGYMVKKATTTTVKFTSTIINGVPTVVPNRSVSSGSSKGMLSVCSPIAMISCLVVVFL